MCHPHSNGNNPGRHTHKAQYDKLADHTPFHEEMTMTNNGTTNTSYTPQITLVPPAHHCIVCLSHNDDWQVTPWHCMHQLIANMTTPPHGKTGTPMHNINSSQHTKKSRKRNHTTNSIHYYYSRHIHHFPTFHHPSSITGSMPTHPIATESPSMAPQFSHNSKPHHLIIRNGCAPSKSFKATAGPQHLQLPTTLTTMPPTFHPHTTQPEISAHNHNPMESNLPDKPDTNSINPPTNSILLTKNKIMQDRQPTAAQQPHLSRPPNTIGNQNHWQAIQIPAIAQAPPKHDPGSLAKLGFQLSSDSTANSHNSGPPTNYAHCTPMQLPAPHHAWTPTANSYQHNNGQPSHEWPIITKWRHPN